MKTIKHSEQNIKIEITQKVARFFSWTLFAKNLEETTDYHLIKYLVY